MPKISFWWQKGCATIYATVILYYSSDCYIELMNVLTAFRDQNYSVQKFDNFFKMFSTISFDNLFDSYMK